MERFDSNEKKFTQQLQKSQSKSRYPSDNGTKNVKCEVWHPYKIILAQELSEEGPDQQVQLCQTLRDMWNTHPLLVKNIVVVSNEVTLTLTRTVNRQNCKYWAKENPKPTKECHTQKIYVWAATAENRAYVPSNLKKLYIIHGTFNSYRNVVSNFVILLPNANISAINMKTFATDVRP